MNPITVLNKSNVPTGPFSRAQVAEKLQSGEVALTDLAFIEGIGLTQWTPLREVLAKVDGVPAVPPLPVAAVPPPIAPAYSYAVTMQPPPHLIYAGFWIRVAAHLIDNIIVTAAFVLVWVIIIGAVAGVGIFARLANFRSDSSGAAVALIGTIVLLYFSLIFGRFIAIWLYHAFLESGPTQATWGKRAMGLKVTSFTGQRISFGHASGRYFSTFITNMTMGIGYLMVAFTDRKQALHDMIAGTLVIKE